MAVLLLVGGALAGELFAPAPVLPALVTIGLLVAVGAGAWWAQHGIGLEKLCAGRGFHVTAVLILVLAAYLVTGQREGVISDGVLKVVLGGGAVFCLTALVWLLWRWRDAAAGLAIVVLGLALGLFAVVPVRDVRIALHADRYRSEGREALEDPPPAPSRADPVELDQVVVGRAAAEAGGPPVVAAWIWITDDAADDPDPRGVVYAPDHAIGDDETLEPAAHVVGVGAITSCTATGADDLYWCSFG